MNRTKIGSTKENTLNAALVQPEQTPLKIQRTSYIGLVYKVRFIEKSMQEQS